ncbi:sugar ABC transporter ATP-binding protein [Arthrobacter sp. K5]|uniref:Sugar ABC transporter ATP-binding protein n=1 Tax=Arthrobacter sp. K5 TaxID=2839623 RepID=A0AAU8EZ41_9MICC
MNHPTSEQISLDRSTTPRDDVIIARGISKRFGGVLALDSVDVSVQRGHVHALVGENGAGKSTLGKLMAGVHSPDGGALLVDGREVRYSAPRDALHDGITLIAQELALVPERTVLENVFLGVEGGTAGFASRKDLRERYEELSERSGLSVDPRARVGSLRVAAQQKVEILRALARGSKVIVMDEPTAALTRDEAGQLLQIIDQLRRQGTTIIYVSHFLHEVLDIADRTTILKDGRLVRTTMAMDETPDTLVQAMLGRAASVAFPERQRPKPDAPVVLAVDNLQRGPAVTGASFQIHAGEIVGIAGLVGSGRSELARLIFGADRPTGGKMFLHGQEVRFRSPRAAVRAGIAMLPESRKDQGLVVGATVRDNVLMAHRPTVSRWGIIQPSRASDVAERTLRDVGATAGRHTVPVSTLSGGNQQKVALGKWLVKRPELLIVDEPTRGVDVGAKRAIYELLIRYAAEGIAILLISSELEEVLGLAHRTLVMRRGEIVEQIDADDATEEVVMPMILGTGRKS